MLKLACPHCQTIGVVPQIMMSAGDWPIACHYCHQHYYAPVLSGPEGMERQIELSCNECRHTSRLDSQSFRTVTEHAFELFCAKCHHNLSEGLTHITHILTEAVNPQDQEVQPEQHTPKLAVKDGEEKSAQQIVNTAEHTLSGQAIAGFGLIGFGFTLAAVLAAQEGLIAREWLDSIFVLLENFPQMLQQLLANMKS